TRLDAGRDESTLETAGDHRDDRSGVASDAARATQIEAHMLASVARITALPETTLRLDQVLTEGLGFDSLMLVDLDEDIRTQWPNIGGPALRPPSPLQHHTE